VGFTVFMSDSKYFSLAPVMLLITTGPFPSIALPYTRPSARQNMLNQEHSFKNVATSKFNEDAV
jgi:hypothetical protein